MLISVSNEISSHLKYYTSFEETELLVDKWDNFVIKSSYEKTLSEKECQDIIELLHRIQDTVKFFKAHLTEYKKDRDRGVRNAARRCVVRAVRR